MILRACFEDLRFEDGHAHAAGWALAPDLEIERLELWLDGARAGELHRIDRPDVAVAFPCVPTALHSGFHGSIPDPAPLERAWRGVSLVARAKEREVARCELRVPRSLDVLGAAPPAHLMQRVAHIVEPRLFWLDGLRAASEVLDALAAHGAPARVRLLDWGCGCGRVLVPLRAQHPDWSLAGVDVDREAVEWLRGAQSGLELAPIAFEPPTPLAGARFDAILGLSVMTHLDRAGQARWLGELERLLVPGGLALVSVHGARALRLAGNPRIAAELAAEGISDGTRDATLSGVLAEPQYRATFQTQAWTRRAWGGSFEILAWLDGGLGGFQDIVVLRARRP